MIVIQIMLTIIFSVILLFFIVLCSVMLLDSEFMIISIVKSSYLLITKSICKNTSNNTYAEFIPKDKFVYTIKFIQYPIKCINYAHKRLQQIKTRSMINYNRETISSHNTFDNIRNPQTQCHNTSNKKEFKPFRMPLHAPDSNTEEKQNQPKENLTQVIIPLTFG